MAGKPPLVSSDLQDSMTAWGLSLKVYRNQNGISQQVFHDWSKETGNTLWNSQLAYAERGLLQPKGGGFFIAFGEWNKFLVNGDFKSIENKTLRERLEQCKPYLNHEGKPANATDFFSLFIGESPINELYTQPQKELTVEFLAEYTEIMAKTFRDVANERIENNKECWDSLLKTDPMKEVEEEQVTQMVKEMLAGQKVPSIKDARFVMGKYKECPVCVGMRHLVDHPLSKEMEDAHADLVSLAA